MPQDIAIETRDLGRSFDRIDAVRSLTLTVPRGEFFGLVGPDGAGKSTVIRLLCAILNPSSGSGSILGYDLRREAEAIKAHIGYLSQAFTLYGDLTVDENIEFFADMHGVPGYHQRRNELLAFTRLTPFRQRPAQALSGGMKKKLALACALIHTPDLLFLDEPSTGVDPVSRGEFWTILSSILAQGITIVMTTPYLDEAERCHRVGLMHKGTLVQTGTPDEIRRSLPGGMHAVLGEPLDSIYRALLLKWPPTALVRYGDRLRFHATRGPAEITQATEWLAQKGLTGIRFEPVTPSLEDVFVALMSNPTPGELP
jgi:ABC-2 type transport system ATP-binding protein